jgi:hypothetical protein
LPEGAPRFSQKRREDRGALFNSANALSEPPADAGPDEAKPMTQPLEELLEAAELDGVPGLENVPEIVRRVRAVNAFHQPRTLHGRLWCAGCSKGLPMGVWVNWPCRTHRILAGLFEESA